MKPVQVMIVDDHPGVRTLIRELIEDCLAACSLSQPRVTECDSGEQALVMLDSCAPALATVDLRMGGMDGLECVRRLRCEVPDALILVVTSVVGDAIVASSRQAGADGVVCKDELTSLQDVIGSHLPRISA